MPRKPSPWAGPERDRMQGGGPRARRSALVFASVRGDRASLLGSGGLLGTEQHNCRFVQSLRRRERVRLSHYRWSLQFGARRAAMHRTKIIGTDPIFRFLAHICASSLKVPGKNSKNYSLA